MGDNENSNGLIVVLLYLILGVLLVGKAQVLAGLTGAAWVFLAVLAVGAVVVAICVAIWGASRSLGWFIWYTVDTAKLVAKSSLGVKLTLAVIAVTALSFMWFHSRGA